MIQFPDLSVLHDRGSLYTGLSQLLLTEELESRLGAHRFDVDLQAGTAVFAAHGSPATVTVGVELIASIAPGPRSLLWARALPVGAGPGGARLAELGCSEDLPSLQRDEVPLPAGPDGTVDVVAAARQICAVVATVTDCGVTSGMPAGGGTYGVLLLSGADFARPRIDHRLPVRMAELLGLGEAHDQRAAVHGLALMAGWRIEWDPRWTRAALDDPVTGNRATAEFDEWARFVRLDASLG